MELRPYQLDAIQAAGDAIRRGVRNILIVAPTGAGKTVIGSHILNRVALKNNYGLFFAHRREIIYQTSEKLDHFDCPHGIYMAGERVSALSKIQVSSQQTFQSRIIRGGKTPPPANVLMFDEAHRSLSVGYQRIRDLYPGAILIGLTATPVRGDGKGLGSMYDEMIEVTSVQQLVDDGYLVPTRIFAPTMPDLTGVRTRGGDYVQEDLEGAMDKARLIGDVVDHWGQHSRGQKTVVFTSGVRHSIHVAESFKAAGVNAVHLDGTTDLETRQRYLDDLRRGRIDVISNCNVLTEGWDCPPVSTGILLRPTKSYGLYLQMAGRILRPWDNKTVATILDHSGAVYRHGRPEDAGNWDLCPDTRIEERIKKEREKEPHQELTCRNCWTVYRDQPECPACGWIPTKQGKALDISEGRLVEVKPKKKVVDKQVVWNECLFKAKYRNLKVGAAAHMYRKKTGVWPRGLDRLPKGNEWKLRAADFVEMTRGQ